MYAIRSYYGTTGTGGHGFGFVTRGLVAGGAGIGSIHFAGTAIAGAGVGGVHLAGAAIAGAGVAGVHLAGTAIAGTGGLGGGFTGAGTVGFRGGGLRATTREYRACAHEGNRADRNNFV